MAAFSESGECLSPVVAGVVLAAVVLLASAVPAAAQEATSPAEMDDDAMTRFHGTDERLSVESFATSVAFFRRLLRNLEELP